MTITMDRVLRRGDWHRPTRAERRDAVTDLFQELHDAKQTIQMQGQLLDEQTQTIEDLVAELLAHSIRQPSNSEDEDDD